MPNSLSGIVNSVSPQPKQTESLGKTNTMGLSRPSSPGKWIAISLLNICCLSDEHLVQVTAYLVSCSTEYPCVVRDKVVLELTAICNYGHKHHWPPPKKNTNVTSPLDLRAPDAGRDGRYTCTPARRDGLCGHTHGRRIVRPCKRSLA